MALLAGLDLFVVVVPTDGLFVSSILARPRRWVFVAVLVAIGSSVGGFVLAQATELFMKGILGAHGTTNLEWLNSILKSVIETPDSSVQKWVEQYGIWAIMIGAISPLPLQPFVVGPVLTGMSVPTIAMSLFAGRLAKYLLLGAVVAYVPRFVPYLKGIQDEIVETERARIRP